MILSRTVRTMFALALFAIGAEALAASEWRTISNAVKHRSEGTLVTRGDSAWLINGFDRDIDLEPSIERYDVRSNRWTLLGSTSTSRSRPNGVTHNGTVRVGNEVWVIGGRVGDSPGRVSDEVWIYDLDRNTWRRGPTLPGPFAGGGAALVDNRIHVFGGIDAAARCDVATHRVLDLSRQGEGWRTLGGAASMPSARNHFATAVVDDIIYAIGGQHGHGGCTRHVGTPQLKLVHAFDPSTGRWTRRADMPTAQSHAEPSTFAYDGRIWAIGGKVRQGADKVFVYDPARNRWEERRELALKRPLLAPGAAIFGDRLFLFAGGAPDVRHPIRDTQVITLPARDVAATNAPTPTPTPESESESGTATSDARAAWRVNVGGPALTDAAGRRWLGDAGSATDGYERAPSRTWSPPRGTNVARRGATTNLPAALFATERYGNDRRHGLTWHFPVTPGRHEVRLHFAETWGGAFATGRRVFDVLAEGALVADDIDVFAEAGARAALTRTFVVSSDARLTLTLRHGVQNPALNGIEIVRLDDAGGPQDDGASAGGGGSGESGGSADDTQGGTRDGTTGDSAGGPTVEAAPAELVESATEIDFGAVASGERATRSLRLSNVGGSPLRVTAIALDGADADDFTAALSGDATIAPGEARTVEIGFRPLVDGAREAVLLVSHDGPSMLSLIALSGRAGGDTSTTVGVRRLVHRLNVGGPALAGHDGIDWSADLDDTRTAYLTTPSRRYAARGPVALDGDAIGERVPSAVFATERYGPSRAHGLAWRFPVPPGRYEVRLHFAEIWHGAFADGRRTFDVLVDGEAVVEALDVFAEAGGGARSVTRAFVVDDTDGRLDVALRHVVQNPAVKGIEILECLDGCPAVD